VQTEKNSGRISNGMAGYMLYPDGGGQAIILDGDAGRMRLANGQHVTLEGTLKGMRFFVKLPDVSAPVPRAKEELTGRISTRGFAGTTLVLEDGTSLILQNVDTRNLQDGQVVTLVGTRDGGLFKLEPAPAAKPDVAPQKEKLTGTIDTRGFAGPMLILENGQSLLLRNVGSLQLRQGMQITLTGVRDASSFVVEASEVAAPAPVPVRVEEFSGTVETRGFAGTELRLDEGGALLLRNTGDIQLVQGAHITVKGKRDGQTLDLGNPQTPKMESKARGGAVRCSGMHF
jgi:hypothetical protein